MSEPTLSGDPGLPITDEQAKAFQEAFKFGTEGLETARAAGKYLAEIIGTVPADVVGLLLGDRLKIRRAENLARSIAKAKARLEADGVLQPDPLSLTLGIPILEAAAEEDRDEIVELLANLLAAAQDPKRKLQVRRRHVELVRQLEPIDTLVLRSLVFHGDNWQRDPVVVLSEEVDAGIRLIQAALRHLIELGLAKEAAVPIPDRIVIPLATPDGADLIDLYAS
jgi:hypothetical protein